MILRLRVGKHLQAELPSDCVVLMVGSRVPDWWPNSRMVDALRVVGKN